MATLSVKPSQRYQLSDWRTNSYLLSTNAERQRDASHQIRQEARILRNETNNQVGGGRSAPSWAIGGPSTIDPRFIWFHLFQTVWDEHDNRVRLAERIDTVNRWKEMLDKCLTNLDAEIDTLTQAGSRAGYQRALMQWSAPPIPLPDLGSYAPLCQSEDRSDLAVPRPTSPCALPF